MFLWAIIHVVRSSDLTQKRNGWTLGLVERRGERCLTTWLNHFRGIPSMHWRGVINPWSSNYIRTHHVPLNSHLNRIGVMHTAACPLCDYPTETVEHYLFYCRKLIDLRGCFLPQIPSISNTLYSNTHQLNQTCKYVRMSLCRRATAQMQLDR